MNDLPHAVGFLGTKALLISDTTLILILVTAVLFTVGWRLAVVQRYQAHRRVQTLAAALNAVVVLSVMISSFQIHILPGLPAKLNEGSYGVTTVHAAVGLVGLVLGVYVVLVANKLAPRGVRFTEYKPIMRWSYALYMLATFIGAVVYVVVYVFGI